MAEDLATLAVVTDGSGARREIQLTADELRKLANTGKITEEALNRAIPPTIAPPDTAPKINAVTAAILRQHEQIRAMRGTLSGTADAMQRVAQAQTAMHEAAARSMASQIAQQDPFQAVGISARLGVPQVKALDVAAKEATLNFNGLRQAMTTLAVASGALPGPLGRIASTLGAFAVGGGVMVAALAGIAALGFAWEKLTEKSRKAREELEKHLDVLRTIKREQDLGITGEAGAATSAGQAELARRLAELRELNRQIQAGPQFTGAGGGMTVGTAALEARRTALIREYVEMEALVRAGETAVTKIVTEESREREQEMREAIRRQRDELNAWAVEHYNKIPEVNELIRDYARGLAKADDEARALANTIQRNLTASVQEAFDKRTKQGLEDIIDGIRRMLEAMKQADQKAKELQATMLGIGLGAIGGVFSQIGGPIGGAVTGAIGGIAGGAPGIAAGAAMGLVDALFKMGDAAKQQREHMRRLRIAFDEFTDSVRVQLGILDPLQAELNQLSRDFDEQRRQWEQIRDNAINQMFHPERVSEAIRQIEILNELERQTRAARQAASVEDFQRSLEDLSIRRLVALGRDEEAEAMRDQVARERELAEARARHASEAEIWAIQEVQRVEAIKKAMDAAQARIDSFNTTITGLQDFRNALLISPSAGLSPTAQLAEARRQYQEILAVALGDDIKKAQAAAGRLPGAAQSLLDFSRQVNASGAGFQTDFLQVLADTQTLIQRFTDLRTIEELMLEELIKIREGVGRAIDEGIIRPPTHQLPDPALVSELQAMVTVSQEGHTQTIAELRTLGAKVDNVAAETRRGMESLQANQTAL